MINAPERIWGGSTVAGRYREYLRADIAAAREAELLDEIERLKADRENGARDYCALMDRYDAAYRAGLEAAAQEVDRDEDDWRTGAELAAAIRALAQEAPADGMKKYFTDPPETAQEALTLLGAITAQICQTCGCSVPASGATVSSTAPSARDFNQSDWIAAAATTTMSSLGDWISGAGALKPADPGWADSIVMDRGPTGKFEGLK